MLSFIIYHFRITATITSINIAIIIFFFFSVRDWPDNELEGVLVEDFGYFTYLEKL